jgi:hypothetical protein
MEIKNNLSVDLVNKILKCLEENPSIHKKIIEEIDLKKTLTSEVRERNFLKELKNENTR